MDSLLCSPVQLEKDSILDLLVLKDGIPVLTAFRIGIPVHLAAWLERNREQIGAFEAGKSLPVLGRFFYEAHLVNRMAADAG